jgi:hypothetical protein
MHVISQSEMSPAGTSNTCGDRTETGVAAISENGNYVAEQEGGYPQSGGETHLLLGPELTLPKQPAGTYVFGIADAVNQTAQDGAPVGATFSGDTILAVVLGGS